MPLYSAEELKLVSAACTCEVYRRNTRALFRIVLLPPVPPPFPPELRDDWPVNLL